MGMTTCKCDTFKPASAQTLCAECAAHRVGECAHCYAPVWWTDLFQVQGTDGRITEECPSCVDRVTYGVD